jgi:hypothetical protein
MSEFKKMRAVLGVVAAAALVAGCSGGASETSPAPAIDLDHAIGTQSIMPKRGCTGGTCNHILAAQVPTTCPSSAAVIPAHYVLELKLGNPSYHYPDPSKDDGYHIQFPTPWVAPSTDLWPYLYETGSRYPYTGLVHVAPSAGAPDPAFGDLRHEYLVHTLDGSPDKRILTEVPGSDKFFVGLSASDFTPAYKYAHLVLSGGEQPFQDPAREVEASITGCVYLLRLDPATGFLVWDGEWYFASDEHDPINWPG